MDKQTEQLILDILASHYFLSLATVREDGYPQATTVAYANDGFKLYFMTGHACQKVHNIQCCNKISLTVDRECEDWEQIKGLSMGGTAAVLSDPDEIAKAATCLEAKFPQMHEWVTATEDMSKAAFVEITPQVISVLNYAKGFGHTELVSVE
ncbi:putative stress protein (general stress protein 26) [Leptolyngbya sp. PCC 7375]|nr:putative stress protein (general stress protein 26) [Leptolyngbya sp. PCC 7375]